MVYDENFTIPLLWLRLFSLFGFALVVDMNDTFLWRSGRVKSKMVAMY